MAHGEVRVGDLTAELGLAQSTVSAHVACLRECGLVQGRTQGRSIYYSLSRPELMDLLATAEGLLAATGNAVDLCPTYGTAAQQNHQNHTAAVAPSHKPCSAAPVAVKPRCWGAGLTGGPSPQSQEKLPAVSCPAVRPTARGVHPERLGGASDASSSRRSGEGRA